MKKIGKKNLLGPAKSVDKGRMRARKIMFGFRLQTWENCQMISKHIKMFIKQKLAAQPIYQIYAYSSTFYTFCSSISFMNKSKYVFCKLGKI